MSEIILPPGLSLPPGIQPIEKPDEEATDEQKATMLPEPKGWKILSDKFENSSIVKADTYMKQEEHATTALFVLKLGPDAYKDESKFTSGAWCKEGDFVLVRTYSGTRFKIYGKEFRLINDDQVEAVVQDPRGLTRA
jgi:co-chaperonin GroES (HSP10)